ncbi:MAG: proton-conducting transporter membrane subunit [Lachnospiraceae bacterium]|nr:proton-conducting transporter membrane subunit [Lachnospiraceae bacterium]
MSRILLCVPALLPLAGGLIILFAAWFGNFSNYRKLGIYTEGLTILNSLILAWLIFGKEESGSFVLFRLFGNLEVMFRLDGMGRVFAGLIGFLWPLAVLYAYEYMRHEKRRTVFFAWYLMTYGVTAGIALSGNLVTMYLFYEVLTLVTFPLVLHPMTKEARLAGRRYLYYSIGGAAFAFLGLVFVLNFSATGNTEFIPGGVLDLQAAGEWKNVLYVVFLLAFSGFSVKAAMFPLHGWLPKATVAPTPVTALLHAVAVVKSGAFAVIRLTYFSFGIEFLKGSWVQWAMMGAAMVSIVFGSTMAVKEAHWKRRLAYSTISNLSYILLAASMMSPLGIVAALSHMVFHGFMKICSFFCAGAVMHQTGKTYIYELDGLGRKMPVTFGCLTVASLSLVGIPLFAGFISKWNIARAAFSCALEFLALKAAGGSGSGNIAAGSIASDSIGAGSIVSGSWGYLAFGAVIVLLYSALMTGIYMLTVLVRAYFPKETENCVEKSGNSVEENENCVEESGNCVREAESSLDPNWMMLVPLVIFAVIILLFGLYSRPLTAFLMEIGGGVV